VVLDAFLALRERRNAVLALFGDGPERAAMEARVKGRDDVRFLGFVRDRDQLAASLASADALRVEHRRGDVVRAPRRRSR
jgi:glycosyltransferase involved in cell wall biosynthesis